eukprot:CAMPEP_0177648880 /NCGR_PEP_ID=MMETSP0447-20121125/11070_1 /TAXON_ID=0 /ORGANISM="Stygamoeba regulata, Strain BSH-02190019" /LENGTH=50 /DNA_ID=CAMNT_0019151563 /DNA_START=59 /DNA_END=207 /DNA_ORIENTATION=-
MSYPPPQGYPSQQGYPPAPVGYAPGDPSMSGSYGQYGAPPPGQYGAPPPG